MEAIEIRELTVDEINAQLNDYREELMKLRFQQATGELTDHNRLKHTRKIVARMLTILTERMYADEEGEE
jgi:large subunit ribosomal protein L29